MTASRTLTRPRQAIIAGFGHFVPGKALLEFGCICVVDANRTSREVVVVEPKS